MDSAQQFSEFYSRHYEAVLCYAMRRCDPETARDVAADTFLVAWRRRTAVPAGPGQEEPWLYGVARRVLANTQRSQRRAQRLAAKLGRDGQAAFAPDPASIFAENARLKHALASLTAKDQEALMLIGWEDLDLAGAALAMGCTRAAMAVRLHRARRRLEEALGGAEWEIRKAPVTRQLPSRTISQETR
jgi:RNA polymerase sigma-70 factor (ECF subfamily)